MCFFASEPSGFIDQRLAVPPRSLRNQIRPPCHIGKASVPSKWVIAWKSAFFGSPTQMSEAVPPRYRFQVKVSVEERVNAHAPDAESTAKRPAQPRGSFEGSPPSGETA